MSRIYLFLILPTIVATVSLSHAATPEQIDKAIVEGKKFIYDAQKPDGTWEGFMKSESYIDGGPTSMCLYALLSTGEKEKDPRLAKAINFVVNLDSNDTYPLAFQALALSKLTQTEHVKKALVKVATRLLEGGENKNSMGVYGYASRKGDGGYYDHSNSQYGLLGVWACADAGVEIPDRYWDEVLKGWLDTRASDNTGAWAYSTLVGPTPSMTAAGIASLFVCDDALAFRNAGNCKGNVNDANIEKALLWLEPHLSGDNDLYLQYGVERIGIASGYKYLGTYDWFKKGADAIVKKQAAEGSWSDFATPVGTSYAILFLYRGRAPIIMNKLRYDKDPAAAEKADGPWNERNRDAAGAAKFIGDQLESFMNWQVVTLKNDPDEFHDSPILYIAGNEPLNFSPEEQAKLKKFIEDGGMILGNADCASVSFADSFKSLCKKLFDGNYEFRPLPADHPLYTHEQFPASKWKTKPDLQGMSNGVRELAILMPTLDPSKYWHLKQFKNKKESFEAIADIYLYSVDRQNIAEKGVTYVVAPDASIKTTASIRLARLQYTGNWDPEPGGFRRLAVIMHNQDKIDLKVEPVKLGAGALSSYSIAHLTGTTQLALDDASRDEIKKFVAAGGMLIVDAAGGSSDFADSAEKELGVMFPADAPQLQTPVSIKSSIFDGMKSDEFHYRSYAREVAKGTLSGSSVRAILLNNRPAVIFSREDISAGLVGENVDGVYGYTPETSVKLLSAIIRSTLPKPATTLPKPATQP